MPMPKIMGVINATPDSFFAGSRVNTVSSALKLADSMIQAGADILDIGGEATSPHLDVTESAISTQQELERVVPLIEAIRHNFDITISVDTSKPKVMQAAVTAGANMINDQRALRLDGALIMAAQLQMPVCLMHMYGLQRKMDCQPYADTLAEIKHFLLSRADACQQAGISKQHIIIDPGIGTGNFGKSTSENLYLINHLQAFADTPYPVLVGLSRKSMVGAILNVAPADRLYGSLGLTALATLRGVSIIRTHDILATVHTVKMVQAASELET